MSLAHFVELVPVIRPVHLSPETGWLCENLGVVVVSGHGSCSRSVSGLGVSVVAVEAPPGAGILPYRLLLQCVSLYCLKLLNMCLLMTFTKLEKTSKHEIRVKFNCRKRHAFQLIVVHPI